MAAISLLAAASARTLGCARATRGGERGRSPLALALPSLLLGLLAACGGQPSASGAENSTIALSFEPSPPKVGSSKVALDLTEGGQALVGAKVHIEGNMNHAGMVPVLADATEDSPGHYTAELEFTMGGDWILLVDATTVDGRQLNWRKDVSGVRSK